MLSKGLQKEITGEIIDFVLKKNIEKDLGLYKNLSIN